MSERKIPAAHEMHLYQLMELRQLITNVLYEMGKSDTLWRVFTPHPNHEVAMNEVLIGSYVIRDVSAMAPEDRLGISLKILDNTNPDYGQKKSGS